MEYPLGDTRLEPTAADRRHHMKLNIRPHTTRHFITHKQHTNKNAKQRPFQAYHQANTRYHHVMYQPRTSVRDYCGSQ